MQPKNRRLVTEQTLEDGMAPYEGRLEGIEAMAGIRPGSVVDGQTANIIQQSDTQTRSAIEGIIAPVDRTARAANSVARNTAGRVDALEVLSDISPGNVNDATIALHVDQQSSLAHDAVSRVVLDVSTNLFNRANVTDGYTLPGGSGELSPNTTHGVSDWIAVQPGVDYTYFQTTRVTFFDEDQEYVYSNNLQNLDTSPTTVTTPPTAVWARLSVHRDRYGLAQMNRGSDLLAYEPGGAPKVKEAYLPDLQELEEGSVTPDKTSFFAVSTNLFNHTDVIDGYTLPAGSGELSPNPLYGVSDWIAVQPGVDYTYFRVTRVTFFDEDQEYVYSTNFQNIDTDHWTVQTPAMATWARLSVHQNGYNLAQMNQGSTLLSYEPGGARLDQQYLPEPSTQEDPLADRYLVDTDGLSQTYDAPTIESQAGLHTTVTDDVHGWYDDLMAAHPDYITRTDLGVSSDGVNHLYAYTLKSPPVPEEDLATKIPAALLISGVHGYEKAAVWHLWRFAKALCQEWDTSPVLDAIRWNFEIVIVPVGSPYSYDASTSNYIRTNANGVDIARNFPTGWSQGTPGSSTYGGTAPLSEPEAYILDQLMHDMAPRTIAGSSFHTMGSTNSYSNTQIWQAAAAPIMLNIGKKTDLQNDPQMAC